MRACAMAAVVVVVGCVEAHWPQPGAEEQRAMDVARETWLDDGRTDCDTPAGLVHAATPEEYSSICLGASTLTSVACFDPNHRLIVFRPGLVQDAKGEPTIHEMMHALQRCHGVRDNDHSDPAVWRAAGGERSLQWQAEQRFIAELDGGAE